MAALLSVVFLSILSTSLGSPSGRIINGKDVKIGEIPYQISLQITKGDFHMHHCSGSIITEYFIVTAAHCVIGFTIKDFTIVTDTVDLNVEGTTHTVVDIIIHENYNAYDSWVNDIALLRSETPFNASMFGILPEPFENPKEGKNAIVSGWGITEEGRMSNVLKKAEIYITEQEKCKNIYERVSQTIHSTQVCANNPKQVTGACNADSGGPMTVDNKLVGIVSWSNNCATPMYPTVFTRVSHYMDWILEHVPLIRPTL